MNGAHQMFCGGFRRGVRAIRGERRTLGKVSVLVFRQTAHHFIGRYLKKATHATLASGVQQHLRTQNVSAQEFMSRGNAAVNVRLGREIDYCVAVFTEGLHHRLTITNVASYKTVAFWIKAV